MPRRTQAAWRRRESLRETHSQGPIATIFFLATTWIEAWHVLDQAQLRRVHEGCAQGKQSLETIVLLFAYKASLLTHSCGH